MASAAVDPVFVSFGEIMLRLSPPEHRRIVQTTTFDVTFGGGEANVAASLAQWGIPARFITAVPAHEVGETCLHWLRGWGIETAHVLRVGERLGLYYLETGAGQRASKVIYDRAGSALAELDPTSIDWDAAFDGATWFHFTGITPALSPNALKAVRQGSAIAKRLGLKVSCDLNYRNKLWSKEEAGRRMSELMKNVDVLLANEEDAESVFGIKGADVEEGKLDRARYVDVAEQLVDRFGFQSVAITLRESYSASRNGWSGVLHHGGESFFARHYDIEVVDRVGSGDSFAAGVVFGLSTGRSPQDTIEFATAASCLKHSVPGDVNIASIAEIEQVAKGGGSGRVQR